MHATHSQFQVLGTQIYDPNGQEFIVKGINMFAWEGIALVDSLINQWGFNTVRVPNYLLGSYYLPHPAEDSYGNNHQIVDAFTSQGAVVIFDAHDLIGSYDKGDEWEILKNYWRDMAWEFKDNPYVWFNLHNESGNAIANPEKWVSYHRELIDIIRAEGADNLIVVDGEAWEKDFYTQTVAKLCSRSLRSKSKYCLFDSCLRTYEFLFDGGWFQGELAVFNLEGMEAYEPGSIALIQEAARRAQTNSNLGYVLIQDSTDKALFNEGLLWEQDFNQGEYGGVSSFTMNRGDKFALMLTQNNTTADIASNPNQIWQWGKLPIFSIPEANPGGDLTRQEAKRTGQIVNVRLLVCGEESN